MELIERYNSYRNSELFWIIANADDYQPEAVEAARKVISSRNLSEEEIQIANKEVEDQRNDETKKELNKSKYNIYLRLNIKEIFSNITPTPNNQLYAKRLIFSISVYFFIVLLLYIINNWKLIFWVFTVKGYPSILTSLFYSIPIIYLAITLVAFIKQKRYGWSLVVIYEFYALLTSFILVYALIQKEFFTARTADVDSQSYELITSTVVLLLWILAIAASCSKKLRNVYKISTNFMLLLLGILLIISFSGIYLFRTLT